MKAHDGEVINKTGVNWVVWERPKLSHSGAVRRPTELDKISFLTVARSLGDLWPWNVKMSSYVVSKKLEFKIQRQCLYDDKSRFTILL